MKRLMFLSLLALQFSLHGNSFIEENAKLEKAFQSRVQQLAQCDEEEGCPVGGDCSVRPGPKSPQMMGECWQLWSGSFNYENFSICFPSQPLIHFRKGGLSVDTYHDGASYFLDVSAYNHYFTPEEEFYIWLEVYSENGWGLASYEFFMLDGFPALDLVAVKRDGSMRAECRFVISRQNEYGVKTYSDPYRWTEHGLYADTFLIE